MIIALQVFFVLALIVVIILFVFQPRRPKRIPMPENYQEYLKDYISFYARLDTPEQQLFEEKLEKFLTSVKITGAGAQAEDLDRVLIGAAAVIPTFFIRDWEYINLREVLLYPGNFNMDFEQQGHDRTISGMVGSGALENVMILSKWELRQGFIDAGSTRNTAIHEFIHLIDKMDGTMDGVPEILLERSYVAQWKQLIEATIQQISRGESDIDVYAATGAVECFAVVSEYFFEQPEAFRANHPEWATMLQRVFVRK